MADTGTGTNYYEILEVATDAPPHEVHKAYQRAKATYSSENPALYSMFSPEEARELLKLIEEAYGVLGNPGLRKVYDEGRARGERSPQVHLHSSSRPPQTPSPQVGNFQQTQQPVTLNASQITTEHRQLPDFAPPALPLIDPPEPKNAEPNKTALAPGQGKTQLSTFKIDEAFEVEIKNATDFDGSFLQRIRLYKNISIDRLSESTRISRSYLTALEGNDYKSLPAAVFTRGFVVQVARHLALNEAKVAASYIKMFKAGGGK